MANKTHEKSRHTMEVLMEAAIQLIGIKGFEATTIVEITQTAGYAKGTFYRYWKSKDEIFLKIMEKRLSVYRKARESALANATTLEETMDVILKFLESMIQDKDWSRIFLEFTIRASRNQILRQELHRSIYRLSNEIFADLVKNHITTDYPPEKMGALNTALFEGFLIHNILGTNVLSMEDFREAAMTLALSNGIQSKRTPDIPEAQ